MNSAMKTFSAVLVLSSTLTVIAASPATTITTSDPATTITASSSPTIVATSDPATTISSSSTSLTRPIALYTNTCGGSSLCSAAISDDCHNAILSVSPGIAYTDQAQFDAGHCSLTYAGAQPLSGQIIIDTANRILDDCQPYACGSYGTGNAGCGECRVTLNYRDEA
ncbi:hypothetical protein DENSPDRAFT_843435 [Dentipellis sp. KUC8613]|nr:hypothetical protein DENSPDRAFT_843435 [Dentipellis sp. KUC8613]